MPYLTWKYTLPVLLLFVLLEAWMGRKEGKPVYRADDSRNNVVIGLMALVASISTRVLAVAVYELAYSFRFFTLPLNGWTWGLAILTADLCYYWYHRKAHEISFLWASHSVHHSSEHFNLTTAFRQSWTCYVSGQFLFWTPMALLGFTPLMIIAGYQVLIFYQALLHTETIHKLHPVFEMIFNTPSHHRVHHGSDEKYLDKNHGGILILWDKLFGTFAREEDRPHYGLTNKLKSENPLIISIDGWKELLQQLKATTSLKEKIVILSSAPKESPKDTSLERKNEEDVHMKAMACMRKGCSRVAICYGLQVLNDSFATERSVLNKIVQD